MRCSCGLWGVRTNVLFSISWCSQGGEHSEADFHLIGEFISRNSENFLVGINVVTPSPKKISFLFFLSNFFLKNKGICDRIFHFQKLCCHLVIFRQNKITGEDFMSFSFRSYSFLIFFLKVFIRILGRGTR